MACCSDKLKNLAINGGPKTYPGTFPGWPQFNPACYDKVVDILKSGKVNYWTGEIGKEFEKKWAEYIGVKNAISVANGTCALHTALASLGIGPGDEVICPSYSFIASSFCALQAGALPVFADTTTDHTIDPKEIEKCITERTRAIVVVHLYGIIADMDPILEIARKHNLKVVEDCAQCFGGKYKGKTAGTLGDVGCFSFCQSKHFTTGGEGGMVVTNDDDLAWECRSFRDHGYDVKERLNLLEMEGKLLYIHKRVGFNFRMTEIQSQIGLCELERFANWNLPTRQRNGKLLIIYADSPAEHAFPVGTDPVRETFGYEHIGPVLKIRYVPFLQPFPEQVEYLRVHIRGGGVVFRVPRLHCRLGHVQIPGDLFHFRYFPSDSVGDSVRDGCEVGESHDIDPFPVFKFACDRILLYRVAQQQYHESYRDAESGQFDDRVESVFPEESDVTFHFVILSFIVLYATMRG